MKGKYHVQMKADEVTHLQVKNADCQQVAGSWENSTKQILLPSLGRATANILVLNSEIAFHVLNHPALLNFVTAALVKLIYVECWTKGLSWSFAPKRKKHKNVQGRDFPLIN